MSAARALGWAAFVLGAAAACAGSPYRGNPAPSESSARADDPTAGMPSVSAAQLAEWIRQREPGLRVIDLRSPEAFEAYRIPGARRHDPDSLDRLAVSDRDELVVVTTDGTLSVQTGARLRRSSAREVLVLRDGIRGWLDEVINPELAADASPEARQRFESRAELSRYFGGQPRIGAPVGSSDGVPTRDRENIEASVAGLRRRGCG